MKPTHCIFRCIFVLVILVMCPVFIMGCNEDDDAVTPTVESLCSMVKARYGDIIIQYPDESCVDTKYTPVFNEYGQVTSIEFSITCGDKKYSGKVTTIVYESDGTIRSFDAVINGQNCHWEK